MVWKGRWRPTETFRFVLNGSEITQRTLDVVAYSVRKKNTEDEMRIDTSKFGNTPIWVIVTTVNGRRVHRVVVKK